MTLQDLSFQSQTFVAGLLDPLYADFCASNVKHFHPPTITLTIPIARGCNTRRPLVHHHGDLG
jgi:hypothetical protein